MLFRIWHSRRLWLPPFVFVCALVLLDARYGGRPALAPFIYNPNR